MATATSNGKNRRSTAEAMAKGQRDISVSEFFAKNKHLLGFDNPRKALLTTVKEAVDNSLDACEEAGIIPVIWVQIDVTHSGRFRISVQDNGPGIVKKQIPLIFGKLLYGSKFHRLRMSRGQQGIGISAAGMNGMLTSGQPVRIVSKVSVRKPAHYFELQIDTKKNAPQIINGRGEGVDIPPGEKGVKYIADHGIAWETEIVHEDGTVAPVTHGTRVAIELAATYKRGRGSVDEYLAQTAIANPHVTIHYRDPDGNSTSYWMSAAELPAEAKEIKPHPYGIELGHLIALLSEDRKNSIAQFLRQSFSCVTPAVAARVCANAKISTRVTTAKIGREQADQLFKAMQETKIRPPSTDCVVPIGRELLLKGLKSVVPGEFHDTVTRPPAVYRGCPFQVEVGIAYGGAPQTQKVAFDELEELVGQSDARTLRQFLINTFSGLGSDTADKILKETALPTRKSPANLKSSELKKLHAALHEINISEGQSCQVLRFANRVPLQFQGGACAITQSVIQTNWRSYGMTQSRGNLPNGPITIIAHIASVWVPFTSESKEAVANYPEIEKELRLALQTVGRSLASFMRKRNTIRQQAERRSVFLRYLGEVATAVSSINGADRDTVYQQLLEVAKEKTSDADVRLDEYGKVILDEVEADEFSDDLATQIE
ncbi:DNA topoisomerase VI subunit B [Planctomycetaceae bacterium SH139]